jgi:excisionase family DNA binding protein
MEIELNRGDWLTVAESAKLLRLTANRVYALLKGGRLKSTKIGRDHLLLRSDVIAFAKKPRAPGRPKKPAVKKK